MASCAKPRVNQTHPQQMDKIDKLTRSTWKSAWFVFQLIFTKFHEIICYTNKYGTCLMPTHRVMTCYGLNAFIGWLESFISWREVLATCFRCAVQWFAHIARANQLDTMDNIRTNFWSWLSTQNSRWTCSTSLFTRTHTHTSKNICKHTRLIECSNAEEQPKKRNEEERPECLRAVWAI